MNKENIAICGLRYGKTKHQAEQIKKYIEENSLTEIKITILDSESKQKLDKIRELIEAPIDNMSLNWQTKLILQILNEGDK